jgi:hypothetical protein
MEVVGEKVEEAERESTEKPLASRVKTPPA